MSDQTVITRVGLNGITVTLSVEVYQQYLGHYIVVSKNGETVATGYRLITGSDIYCYNPPAGATSLLKGLDVIQPLHSATTDLIVSALVEFNNLPTIRLPRELNELLESITSANDEHEYQLEQNYDDGIGYLRSFETEEKIKSAYKALSDFYLQNPEFEKQVKREKAEETARQINSALNQ